MVTRIQRILWRKGFQITGNAPASTYRNELSCKHGVYIHFPKDRNSEICKRTKTTRVPCRKRAGEAIPRAENFGDFMTADHKDLSEGCELETITDTVSWYKIWQLYGFNHIRVKQKLYKKQKRACRSSWSPHRNQKSFTLATPWNLAKLVKTYPGIIVRRHRTDRKQMGLLRDGYAGERR